MKNFRFNFSKNYLCIVLLLLSSSINGQSRESFNTFPVGG